MAYGARLESVLGASPHGFESHILRAPRKRTFTNETVKKPSEKSGGFCLASGLLARGKNNRQNDDILDEVNKPRKDNAAGLDDCKGK